MVSNGPSIHAISFRVSSRSDTVRYAVIPTYHSAGTNRKHMSVNQTRLKQIYSPFQEFIIDSFASIDINRYQ